MIRRTWGREIDPDQRPEKGSRDIRISVWRRTLGKSGSAAREHKRDEALLRLLRSIGWQRIEAPAPHHP